MAIKIKMNTDDEIKKEIDEQFRSDSRLKEANIKIHVDNGLVILKGSALSYFVKQAATEDAWTVPGIVEVDNDINITYPPAMIMPTDDEIESIAKDTLRHNPNIDESKIEITVKSGIVFLEGSADAFWEKELAEDLMANLTGVFGVDNKLIIAPGGGVVDEEIARIIMAKISRIEDVDPESINIKSERGYVTLSGLVPDRAAREAVRNIVSRTGGVTGIRNDIIVGY